MAHGRLLGQEQRRPFVASHTASPNERRAALGQQPTQERLQHVGIDEVRHFFGDGRENHLNKVVARQQGEGEAETAEVFIVGDAARQLAGRADAVEAQLHIHPFHARDGKVG